MAANRTLVLVCNSHIDPVWLWPWEEGLSATLSTFRAAADLCEEFDGFVFCHNEALLYAWVEQYEPALFARIRRLIRDRRWHVMGGWYLQPDCNLPSGEGLVRQILVGKRYFLDRFGVEPTVAVNLDSFGHARGLVQILRKSGYDGYLFCRPDAQSLTLPADDFIWVGHDGSELVAHRSREHYNSERGRARAKVDRWLGAAPPDAGCMMLLWGIGNHGGGPSREDLRAIGDLRRERGDWTIVHGRPEDYFGTIAADASLPRHPADLNPWAVGCYTSMATVKRAYARLERSLFAAEAMLATAAVQGLLEYPGAELRTALEDLLFCQFHDILPGEGVREVERQALDRLGHGQDIVGRLRARAFFASLSGQPAAAEGEYPLFVHNHHPVAVDEIVACEFQPPEPNPDRTTLWQPRILDADGLEVPAQLEKESCNIRNDQRKRVVFRCRLAPSRTTRFTCRLISIPRPPDGDPRPVARRLLHRSDRMELGIDPTSGLLDSYRIDGVDFIAGPTVRPLVMKDSADPWGMKVPAFRDPAGEFTLMSPEAAAIFAGVASPRLAPVRIIEDGPVRTVVEALFEFGRSAMALRYMLPRLGTELGIEAFVSWAEKDRMLKLAVATPFAGGVVRSRRAYGVDLLPPDTPEEICHRWVAVSAPDKRHVLTVINESTYGFDACGGEIRLSMLRAPAYAGHPVDDVTPIVRQDRYEPRVDQGEHVFRFWLNGGAAGERLAAVDREAAARAGGLMSLCVFPAGGGRPALQGLVLDDPAVALGALKMSEDGGRLIARLFEPTGRGRHVGVRLPALDLAVDVALGPFEIKTLAIDPGTRRINEVDLLERETRQP